jgi:uncharacterized protein YerC
MNTSERSDYKVYVHQKADDGTIFYVGKGRRWRENQKHNRNKHWSRVVAKHGFKVCVVASNLTNKDACAFEKLIISKLNIDTLTNYTIGGEGAEGYKHTEKSKEKMKGRKLSEEHKKKLSESKLQKPTKYWLNKKRYQETINKIKKFNTFPEREKVESMLIDGDDRKKIREETGRSLRYIAAVASKLRKRGHKIERLIN